MCLLWAGSPIQRASYHYTEDFSLIIPAWIDHNDERVTYKSNIDLVRAVHALSLEEYDFDKVVQRFGITHLDMSALE